MLTALGSGSYNPTITDLQFTSQSVANYTVSNVWIGNGSGVFRLPVPEPASCLLMLSALAMLASRRRLLISR